MFENVEKRKEQRSFVAKVLKLDSKLGRRIRVKGDSFETKSQNYHFVATVYIYQYNEIQRQPRFELQEQRY